MTFYNKIFGSDSCHGIMVLSLNIKVLTTQLIVSPDKSRGYFGFSTVTLLRQRFPFGRDNLKNILVKPFKFGMWVYMGNAMNAIAL